MNLNQKQIENLKEKYPPGSIVQCIHLIDLETLIPTGSLGIVDRVDEQGYIQTKWDNGSFISLVPGEDAFMKVCGQYD